MKHAEVSAGAARDPGSRVQGAAWRGPRKMAPARRRAQTFGQSPAADHSPSGRCCVPAGIREDAWACSQHHPQGFAGGAVPGASVVCPTAAGPGEDSSYSELEHEGPQKLIHKVSTSEQMGTKLSALTEAVFLLDADPQKKKLVIPSPRRRLMERKGKDGVNP